MNVDYHLDMLIRALYQLKENVSREYAMLFEKLMQNRKHIMLEVNQYIDKVIQIQAACQKTSGICFYKQLEDGKIRDFKQLCTPPILKVKEINYFMKFKRVSQILSWVPQKIECNHDISNTFVAKCKNLHCISCINSQNPLISKRRDPHARCSHSMKFSPKDIDIIYGLSSGTT